MLVKKDAHPSKKSQWKMLKIESWTKRSHIFIVLRQTQVVVLSKKKKKVNIQILAQQRWKKEEGENETLDLKWEKEKEESFFGKREEREGG